MTSLLDLYAFSFKYLTPIHLVELMKHKTPAIKDTYNKLTLEELRKNYHNGLVFPKEVDEAVEMVFNTKEALSEAECKNTV
jgi:hypothetical protein